MISAILTDIRSKYYGVPVDMSSNKIMLVCKIFHLQRFVKDFGYDSISDNPTYTGTDFNKIKFFPILGEFLSLSASIDKKENLTFLIVLICHPNSWVLKTLNNYSKSCFL